MANPGFKQCSANMEKWEPQPRREYYLTCFKRPDLTEYFALACGMRHLGMFEDRDSAYAKASQDFSREVGPLDWTAIAKAAGCYGIRFPTNAALESFLYEISHPATSETGASLGVKAQITPFSSVVGQSVLLLDDDGTALAHLSISIPNPDKPYRETAEEVARIIELAINQPPSEEVKKLRVRLADLMAADAKRMAGR